MKTGAESHEIFTTGEVVLIQSSCTDPESFVREGPTMTFFILLFLVDEGRTEDPYYHLKHLKAGHHRPTSETPFKWRFASRPLIARH